MNWAPLSEVNSSWTPNLETLPLKKASAQCLVVVLETRTASAHLVVRSTMVKMCMWPSAEFGKGPTRSTCTCVNPLLGTGMGWTTARTCLPTLDLAQSWQSRTQPLMSEAMPSHTKWAVIICCVAFTPACAMPWICWKTDRLLSLGTRGPTALEDTSHRRSEPPTVNAVTCKEETVVPSLMSGQLFWASASRWRSSLFPEAAPLMEERSRSVDEK